MKSMSVLSSNEWQWQDSSSSSNGCHNDMPYFLCLASLVPFQSCVVLYAWRWCHNGPLYSAYLGNWVPVFLQIRHSLLVWSPLTGSRPGWPLTPCQRAGSWASSTYTSPAITTGRLSHRNQNEIVDILKQTFWYVFLNKNVRFSVSGELPCPNDNAFYYQTAGPAIESCLIRCSPVSRAWFTRLLIRRL